MYAWNEKQLQGVDWIEYSKFLYEKHSLIHDGSRVVSTSAAASVTFIEVSWIWLGSSQKLLSSLSKLLPVRVQQQILYM